jgi:hypothetical protein
MAAYLQADSLCTWHITRISLQWRATAFLQIALAICLGQAEKADTVTSLLQQAF